MLHHQLIGLIDSVSSWQGSANSDRKPQQKPQIEIRPMIGVLAGSLLGGLVATQTLAFSNLAAVIPEAIGQTTAEQSVISTSTSNSLPDGVYLYGQSPELNQIGQTYMVFESRGGKMIGALYMPQSEFDCFYGTRQGNKLALTVVNSYDRTPHTFAVGITQQYPVASTSDRLTDGQLGLEGFHEIENLRELDRNLLATCKQDYQNQIW